MSTFQGVADTLFIPLEARIFVSKKYPEYFFDAKSIELEKNIKHNSIRKKSSEYLLLASVSRYYNMDIMTKSFISKHSKCNIIYLGAGLETAYFRLHSFDKYKTMFYEIDLPKVIDLRCSLLGEYENEILISSDMFNLSWSDQIDKSLPSLLIISGVFQYFTENKVIQFIHDVQENFTCAELIFDATNETGLVYANKYVIKTGNTDAVMYFYINDADEFSEKTDTVLIEERLFFTDARRILKKQLNLFTHIAMKAVDKNHRAFIMHIKTKQFQRQYLL